MKGLMIFLIFLLPACSSLQPKNGLRTADAFSTIQEPNEDDVLAKHRFWSDTEITERCITWEKNRFESDNKSRACLVKVLDDNSALYSDFNKNCLYEIEDVRCKRNRNIIIDLAIKVVNENCTHFREKVFTSKIVGDAANGVIRDIFPLGSAAAASANPAASIGLSLSSILMNSYQKADEQLFLKRTFQTFDSAIEQASEREREYIATNCKAKPYPDCTIYSTLDYIKSYANACSFRSALSTIDEALRNADINKSNNELTTKLNELDTTVAGYSKSVAEVKNVVSEINKSVDLTQIQTKLESLKDVENSLNDMRSEIEKMRNSLPSVPKAP